jgi:transposase
VASERDTPEHRRYRRKFCAELLALNLKRLVFLDESFCKTGMRREHGWSRRGDRVTGDRPFRAWKTISLIGAIRVGRRPLLMTNRGPVDGKVFLRFVRRRLVAWLKPGDVVFMDNLNIHKMRAVRAAIEDAGATPIYLPTYSPELNPIELWWGDMKRALRKVGADLSDDLLRHVRKLRAGVPLSKISGWFRRALSFAQCK